MHYLKQEKAPTIQDVARHANVAVGTVSRVLNDSPGVKPATRQRVLEVIQQLDYSPNLIARSMTSRRTGSIGVIVPFFTRPFFSEVLRGVEVALTQARHEFILYNVQSNEQCVAYFRTLPKQHKVDGMLVLSLYPSDEDVANFQRAGMPVVLIDAFHPQLTSLVVNNAEGAFQAVMSLLEHGHRRIGFINGITEGNFHFNRANERYKGLQRAFSTMGMTHEDDLVVNVTWDRQGGRQAAMHLLTSPNRPTAIFATSDLQAIGVLEVARTLNLAVPADLSVIGFDGIELSEIMELSTVQQPMHHLGVLGAQKLIELIDTHEPLTAQPELIHLQPNLLLRRTVNAIQPQ